MLVARNDAVKASGIYRPYSVIHDLVEIAKRLGDDVATIWATYPHEFDARRRSAERQAALETIYGAEDGPRMAPYLPSRAVTDGAKVQRLRASQ